MEKDKIKTAIKSTASLVSVIIQGIAALIFGGALLFKSQLVVEIVNLVIFVLLCLTVVAQVIEACMKFFSGHRKEAFSVIARGVITAGVTFFLFSNTDRLWALLPMGIGFIALLNGITHMITFWQYRKEASVRKLSHLIAGVGGLGLGIWVFGALYARIDTALWVFGIYLIFYGLMVLVDGIDAMITPERKSRIKRRVRITLPIFIAALIPLRVQNKINEYFKRDDDMILTERAAEGMQPNVEVFVHVSPDGFGAMGHVDLAVNGRVISYGGYDEKNMKLFGGVGPGIIFTVEDKEKYIRFCKKENNKMLFGFGIYLKDDEIAALLKAFEETLQVSKQWDPPRDGLYAGKLADATGATLYRVQQGPFKYYFVLGQNCVKYADHLLRCSGFPGVISGMISPGTYYDYLTKEFNAATGGVITRNVY